MDSLQTAVDTHSRELLPIVLRVFTFIYTVIALAHFVVLPDAIVYPMAGIAMFSVLVGVVLQLRIDQPMVQNNAEYLTVFLLLLMALNSMAHLYLSADIKQTTNFIFVMAVSGYLLPGYRTFYPTLLTLILTWVLLVLLVVEWNSEATHFSFEILLGAMFALFLHSVRRNQLKQFTDLEATVVRLNDSQNQVVARESLMQSLIDNIPAGILVRGSDTRIRYLNAEAKRILDMEDRSAIGWATDENLFHLYDQTGRKLTEEELPVNRVLATGVPVQNEILGSMRRDGEMNWGLLNAFPLDIQTTNETVIVLAFINITERVKAEMQLHESETRARTILDSVEEGVISVDRARMVTSFNPSAQELLGLTETEALGRPLDSIFNYIDNYVDTKQQLDEGFQVIREGKLRTASGNEIAIELMISELLDGDDLTGWVYTFRDVGEQVRLELERATMDKMSSVGLLAGGIAHDFNNLLTAIYGNVALAESVIHEPDKALEFLNRSSESIQMATNLTKQLLTFAIGSEPVRDVVDVEKLVREASQFSLSGSSIAVTFSIEPGVDAVEVDDGQMRQAISNIVLNAKQAMNDHGRIRIDISNQVQGSEQRFVAVKITDDGPGIEAELLPRIFDPYFTTKDTGTGLGLATTHSIVVKHGGHISVESRVGTGTTFRMLLPSAGPMTAASDIDATLKAGQKLRLEILVMDDEEVVLQTITRLLEHLGHKVTGTRDGTEAITVYVKKMQAGERFDLVIMDLTVAGGMGGRLAASEILEIDPGARLVVSSGYSAGAEMAHYRELGFRARLEKPFRASDLEAMISEVMSQPRR